MVLSDYDKTDWGLLPLIKNELLSLMPAAFNGMWSLWLSFLIISPLSQYTLKREYSFIFFFCLQSEKEKWHLNWFFFFIIAVPQCTNLWHRPKLKTFLFVLTRQFSLHFFSINHCSHNFSYDSELSLWSRLLELRSIINITKHNYDGGITTS